MTVTDIVNAGRTGAITHADMIAQLAAYPYTLPTYDPDDPDSGLEQPWPIPGTATELTAMVDSGLLTMAEYGEVYAAMPHSVVT